MKEESVFNSSLNPKEPSSSLSSSLRIASPLYIWSSTSTTDEYEHLKFVKIIKFYKFVYSFFYYLLKNFILTAKVLATLVFMLILEFISIAFIIPLAKVMVLESLLNV